MKVYVLINNFSDRHGDKGTTVIGVFSTIDSAKSAMNADVESYTKDMVNSKLTIDEIINGALENEVEYFAMSDTSFEIDIDGDGTNSAWMISENEVK